MYTSPLRPPALGTTPQTFEPFWWTVETRWCLATFNAHHPSWFSRTDDRAAARGEALDGAVNSSKLAVVNQDLPTRLPSQGQPSSPDVTLLSGPLLPDVTWSTLTSLGSNHLPLQSRPALTTGNTVLHELPQSLLGGIHSRNREVNLLIPLYQPPALLGKKSSGRSSAMLEDTTSPVVMLGIIAAFSRKLCDSSSRREISAALMTPSTLHQAAGPGHPAAHPTGSARTVEIPAGILQQRYQFQALLVPTAQAGRQEVESPTEYFNRLQWKKPLQPEGDHTSSQQAFTACSAQQDQAGVPQGSIISPALFSHFVPDCPIHDLRQFYANDFTLLASAPSIMEAEARENQLCSLYHTGEVGRW